VITHGASRAARLADRRADLRGLAGQVRVRARAHAAVDETSALGYIGPGGDGPCILDRVTSSYTSTVSALAQANARLLSTAAENWLWPRLRDDRGG
jgi:hypothetical protein